MIQRSDDWEIVDGFPRWVWRADDEFSKMPSVSSPADLNERAKELVARVERLRQTYCPDWSPERFERWMAPRLEECRRVRNLLTFTMDGSRPARVN